MEPSLAPTDSRHRPDQRLMEIGNWDEANRVKVLLEEKQRAAARRLLATSAGLISSCHVIIGKENVDYFSDSRGWIK